MVTATEWLKKAETKRSKNPEKFKAVRRRAWDYVDSTPTQLLELESTSVINEPIKESNKIWEQKEEQIRSETRNNEEQKWEQYGNKNGNIREQKEEQYKNKYENEYKNKQSIKPLKEPFLNLDDTTVRKRLLTLTGHQKQVMSHITSHLKSRVGESSIDILPNILAIKINAGLEVTRVTLKRLTGKQLLIRLPGERGRNGCCKFQIPENVVKICFSLFDDAPCDINHIGNEIRNNNRKNIPYSSSNNINTTTVLPSEWKKINFVPLESIGFSEQHLQDIYSSNICDPVVVQESIYHFAFGLEEGRHKQYDSPLKVFIGRLRKGNAWIESNYESPKDKALRKLIEHKKSEKEKRDLMLKELIELEFPSWRKTLAQDEIKKIVPDEILKANLAPAITASLRTYFIDNILLKKIEGEK